MKNYYKLFFIFSVILLIYSCKNVVQNHNTYLNQIETPCDCIDFSLKIISVVDSINLTIEKVKIIKLEDFKKIDSVLLKKNFLLMDNYVDELNQINVLCRSKFEFNLIKKCIDNKLKQESANPKLNYLKMIYK